MPNAGRWMGAVYGPIGKSAPMAINPSFEQLIKQFDNGAADINKFP